MSLLLIEVILIGNLENIEGHKEEKKNSQIPVPANVLGYFFPSYFTSHMHRHKYNLII